MFCRRPTVSRVVNYKVMLQVHGGESGADAWGMLLFLKISPSLPLHALQ